MSAGSRDGILPGWAELPDGRVVPAGDWNAGSHSGGHTGPAQIVCLRQQGQPPVFQGLLNPDGTVTLLDIAGHELGVGTFGLDGRALEVTLRDGSAQTIDLAGTTLQVSAGGRSSTFTVGSDGQLHVATGVGGQAPAVPAGAMTGQPSAGQTTGNPQVVTAGGQTVPLGEWLQQGPMVIAPDGEQMTENEFVYRYGDDPNNPWVMTQGGQMVLLDDWLQQGPMVIAPDGKAMHENQFWYLYGEDPGDRWIVAPDGHVMHRSQFRSWGPTVTMPNGQTMPLGGFLLTHENDPSNPWMYVSDGRNGAETLVMTRGELAADIQSLQSLGDHMYAAGESVLGAKQQLEAVMSSIDAPEQNGLDDGWRRAFGDDFDPTTGVTVRAQWETGWAHITAGFDNLWKSLFNVGDGLYATMEQLWEAEQANAKSLGIGVSFPGQTAPNMGRRGNVR